MSVQDQEISSLIVPYDEAAEHVKGTRTGTRGTSTALYATLAGIMIGCPLLCMMGFSFTASAAILLITSPLLFIFSPLLISAAFVLVAAMAGFAAAATLGLAGIWMFRFMIRAKSTTIGSVPSSDGDGSPVGIVSTENPNPTVDGRMIE
ncbi:oleosin 5-like [Telopea speciosissima]|uniref:oleosin 5-like n=1 Tax=Telopea speciosissima TaxID=54955 RepID=UPI001CC75B07|nr:oleosin 5-like [Telopea speciosissima]